MNEFRQNGGSRSGENEQEFQDLDRADCAGKRTCFRDQKASLVKLGMEIEEQNVRLGEQMSEQGTLKRLP